MLSNVLNFLELFFHKKIIVTEKYEQKYDVYNLIQIGCLYIYIKRVCKIFSATKFFYIFKQYINYCILDIV